MKINKDVVNKMAAEGMNKRVDSRVNYNIDIFYPIVNNVSVYKQFDSNTPIMKAVNISESGICFESRFSAKPGEFISFMLKIGSYPSFWCLSEVKWAGKKGDKYIIGCRFYLLSDEYNRILKEYVKYGSR